MMLSVFVVATLAALVQGQNAGMLSMMGAMGGGGMMGGGFRHPSSFAGMSLEGLCNFYSLQARGDKGVLSDMMAQGVPMLINSPAMLMMNPNLAGGPQYQCLAKVYATMSPAEFAGAMSDLADGAGCYNFFCFDGLMPGVIANTPENAFRLAMLRRQNRMQGIGRGPAAAGPSTSLGSLIANSMGGNTMGGMPGMNMGQPQNPMSGMGGGNSMMGGAPNLMGGATPGMGGANSGMGGGSTGMGGANNNGGLSGLLGLPSLPAMGGANLGMGGRTPGMGGNTMGLGGSTGGMGLDQGTTGLAGSLNSPVPGAPSLPLDPMAGAGTGTTSAGSPSTGVTSPVDPAPPAQTGAPVTSAGGMAGGQSLDQLMTQLQTQYDPARLQRLLSAILTNPVLKMMF